MGHLKLFSAALLAAALCNPFLPGQKANATIVISGGSWTSNGLPATVTDPDITITGTFVVNTNGTFDNCPNIKMGAGAVIEVNDGITLTVNKSHLYTPGNYMWKGIMVDGTATSGGTVRISSITQYTIIEDAEKAIYGGETGVIGQRANYNFDLDGVIFNRNLVSIYKYNTSTYYSTGATMDAKHFLVTCVNDPTLATPVPATLKPNYVNFTKPEYGMLFGRIGTVNLGHMHPGYAPGAFRYLNAGVHTFHCAVNGYHLSFNDIQNYDPGINDNPDIRGIGYNAYATFTTTGAPIAPATRLVYNSFANCLLGARSGRHGTMQILSCGFQNCPTAIRSNNDINGNVEIDLCGIAGCDYGIVVNNTTNNTLKITRNTIAVNWPAKFGGTPFTTAGISLNMAAPANTGTVNIANNDITCGKIGVLLSQAQGCTVKDNIFRYQNYVVPTPVIPGVAVSRSEINLIGGSGHTVTTNSLRGTTIGTTLPGGTSSPVEYQYGITTTTSPGNMIGCNTTGNQYAGFRFQGQNANTVFHGNTFTAGTDFQTGVFLEDYAGAGTLIGQQGTPGGAGHDNDFSGSYNYTGNYRTLCEVNTNGSLSRFVYRSGSAASPTPNGGPSPITITGTAASGSVTSCSPPLAFRIYGPGNAGTDVEPIDASSLDAALAIATNTLYDPATDDHPYNEMLRFESRRFLYGYLDVRPELRSSDYPELEDFYKNAAHSDYALLYLADKEMLVFRDNLVTIYDDAGQAAIEQARNYLAAVDPDNIYAAYEAQLRLMSLAQIDATEPGYSPEEREVINLVANMCPGDIGPAVYMARNMSLSWDPGVAYDDATACGGTALKGGSRSGSLWNDAHGLSAVTGNATALAHSMVPNPASDQVTLSLLQAQAAADDIRFYDVTGRLVSTFALPARSSVRTMDISSFAPGLYIYSNRAGTIKGKLVKK